MTCETLIVLLTHQDAARVGRMARRWERTGAELLVAHAGRREDFEGIEGVRKVFVEDPLIRTRHHQRERQSYTALYRVASAEAERAGARFVLLAEYDYYPVAEDLPARLAGRMERERAGLLGYHVRRVDGTNEPHFLYHAADGWFREWYAGQSRRGEKGVILSMLGTGVLWRAEVLAEVLAAGEPPGRVYHELHFPTLAHHLGFRVRGMADQNPFVRVGAEWDPRRAPAEAWALHPVKRAWEGDESG